jgi:hypothetical protein
VLAHQAFAIRDADIPPSRSVVGQENGWGSAPNATKPAEDVSHLIEGNVLYQTSQQQTAGPPDSRVQHHEARVAGALAQLSAQLPASGPFAGAAVAGYRATEADQLLLGLATHLEPATGSG